MNPRSTQKVPSKGDSGRPAPYSTDAAGWSELEVWRRHDAGRPGISAESIARAFGDFVAAAVGRI